MKNRPQKNFSTSHYGRILFLPYHAGYRYAVYQGMEAATLAAGGTLGRPGGAAPRPPALALGTDHLGAAMPAGKKNKKEH